MYLSAQYCNWAILGKMERSRLEKGKCVTWGVPLLLVARAVNRGRERLQVARARHEGQRLLLRPPMALALLN